MRPQFGVMSATLSMSETFSNNHPVSVASRGAFYKNRPPSERRLLVLLVAAILLSIALIIALAILPFHYSRHETEVRLCDSTDCIRSASSLLQSMDRTVDPCEDFYTFTCGNWADEHPTPETAIENNWFAERTRHVMRRIRDHLNKNGFDSEPVPVTKARVMYKSCMDTEELDSQGLEPMFQVLRDIGMQVRPSLQNETTQEPFSWVPVVVRTKRLVFQDLLFGFSISPQNTNRTIRRLTLGTPDDERPLPGYQDADKQIEKRRKAKRNKRDAGEEEEEEEEDRYDAAFLRYLAKVISYIYRWNNTARMDKDAELAVKNAAMRILEMDKRLTEVLKENEGNEDAIEMSVEELQKLTNDNLNGSLQWNWTEYLKLMFEGIVNVNLDLEGEDKIMVKNANYLVSLLKLLSETPTKTLKLTLWWKVVNVLAPHTNRDLRQMKERYIETVMGGMEPETRSMFCTNSAKDMMDMAVSYFIADIQFLDVTKSKVEDMLADIQWAFSTLVRSADWMDGDAKVATLDKADAVKQFVGFSEWLLDKDQLQEYYGDVQVKETTYLLNMLNNVGMLMTTMLQRLRIPNRDSFALNPIDVNAFYYSGANAIAVPSGILQFPFYGLGLEALNYGATGTTLGHELMHGFDNSGRKYDRNGNMRQWWTNATVDEYVKRSACYIEQYSSYRLVEIDDWVNGHLTLGENIADNEGFRESLMAYRRYRQRNGPEALLPGLEAFSEEQLFFLSFAHTWCENWSKESLHWSKDDEHPPNHIRVLGVLSNSPEFSEVWNCSKGSTMNPKRDKCRIW